MQSLSLQDAQSFGLHIKTPVLKLTCTLKYLSGPNAINHFFCQSCTQKLVQIC